MTISGRDWLFRWLMDVPGRLIVAGCVLFPLGSYPLCDIFFGVLEISNFTTCTLKLGLSGPLIFWKGTKIGIRAWKSWCPFGTSDHDWNLEICFASSTLPLHSHMNLSCNNYRYLNKIALPEVWTGLKFLIPKFVGEDRRQADEKLDDTGVDAVLAPLGVVYAQDAGPWSFLECPRSFFGWCSSQVFSKISRLFPISLSLSLLVPRSCDSH